MTTLAKTFLGYAPLRPRPLAIPARSFLPGDTLRFWLALSAAGMIIAAIGLYIFSVNASILEGRRIQGLERALKEEIRNLEQAERELSQYASPQTPRAHPRVEAMVEVQAVTFVRKGTSLAVLPER